MNHHGDADEVEEKTPLLPPKETDNLPAVKIQGTKTATFSDLFRFADCIDKLLMLIGGLFAIVHGSGWPVLSIVMGRMTTDFVNYKGNFSGNDSVFVGNNTDEIAKLFADRMTTYALYYVYIGAGVFVASYLQTSCFATACERQCHRFRKKYLYAMLKQEIKWFDSKQSGELTTRLADDLERVREGIGDKFALIIQCFAACIAGFVIGFYYSWNMSLVLLSLMPLMAIGAAVMGKWMASYSKKEQDIYATAGSVAEEVLSCIRTVISFNGQKQELDRYNARLEISKLYGIRKGYLQGLMTGFVYLVMFGSYGLAFWYGTELVKKDELESGVVLTVFFSVMIGSFSIGGAGPNVTALLTAKGAASELINTIDTVPSIDATSSEGVKPTTIKGEVEFHNVKFSYPAKDKRPEMQVLKGFNMKVQKGQTVALVGPSGCGKSTVMSLIQRFYDPREGMVTFDGTDIRHLNVAWLRQSIGVVSQEPILFSYTIEENIRLGKPEATDHEVRQAAKEANAHDFIMRLPKGYQTIVGERGAQLSGGQKQRVAIARALVRNPKILLLDEATSALDSESEKVVQDALDKVSEGRTTILIAHRLSTVQKSDIIYVVDNGMVFEQGTHADLMAKKSLYYELVSAQQLASDDSEENSAADDDEGEDETTLGDQDAAEHSEHTEGGTFESKKDSSRRRSRTKSSSSGTGQKLGRQVSRQTSVMERQDSMTDKTGKTAKEEIETPQEKVENLPSFFRILRENGPECVFVIIGILSSGVNGATMPAFAIFFSEMIKVWQNDYDQSLLWSMMFVALGGVNFLMQSISNAALGQSGERMTQRLRLKLFKAILRQDVSYFDELTHSTGALTTRLAVDATLVKSATGIRMALYVNCLVSMISALVIAFIFGWRLAFVVLGAVPLLFIAGALKMRIMMNQHRKDKSMLENAGKVASEAIENIRTVQSLGQEMFFYNSFCRSIYGPFMTNLKQAQIIGLSFGFSEGIVFLIYGGAFRFGAWEVEQGHMEASNVFRVFFAIAFTGMTIGQIFSMIPDYSKAKHAAGLIFQTLETVPPIDVYSQKGVYSEKMTGNIKLTDVDFSYPSRPEVSVLSKLSFEVKPGQRVALVGSSGCGKSTVISLIQRFYDPSNGMITFDGFDLKNLHLARARSFIGVVSQEPILFDCSFKENIAYGIDKHVGMDEIIQAARVANIHDFITSLPLGYDTNVGEKGAQISGGQKQRVAIARAIIRNPQILLLDEATSALDTESEKLVQAALEKIQVGRTCIIIAHRLSTIQDCDVIYVMDSGRIVEKGTHQELLAHRGVYSSLVHAQHLAM